MKIPCLLLFALSLCSCNTTIGFGRDLKEGFNWAGRKIQEKRQGGSQPEYDGGGAPVY